MEAHGDHSEYFELRYDGLARHWSTLLSKCSMALQMLAYGMFIDCADEYLKISRNMEMSCTKKAYSEGIIVVVDKEYFKKTNISRCCGSQGCKCFPKHVGKH